MKADYAKLSASIIICQVIGFITSFFSKAVNSDWYQSLIKPNSILPNSWMGPIWIFMFLLMGFGLYYVWSSRLKEKQEVLKWFAIHWVVTVAWSAMFFGMHSLISGFVVLILVIGSLGIVMNKGYYLNRKITYVLLPYLLWLIYEFHLNGTIIYLNL